MSEKSKRGTSYRSRLDRRLRRFYLTLATLGILGALCWFAIMPWMTRDPHPRRGMMKEGASSALHESVGVSGDGVVSEPPESALRVQVEKLEEELAGCMKTNELLRSDLAEKEETLQAFAAELETERDTSRSRQAQLAEADAKAAETSARLQDALSTLQEAAKRLEVQKVQEVELADALEQNRMLDAERNKLRGQLDAETVRSRDLQQQLDDVQDEGFRQRQALVALHERMKAGDTNALLLDSVAMAQWRLLHYDAEWVLRSLSSMTPETQTETVRECMERLQENLHP
ncbi:MAG: hypothetical protein PHP44_04250 [Kiritimatiellae bacterium]|nr:hypothetical protein [Kiritimatiellia bacterium]